MTHGDFKYRTRVARCPGCKEIHIIIQSHGRTIISFPMTREDWAKLLGEYGDLVSEGRYELN